MVRDRKSNSKNYGTMRCVTQNHSRQLRPRLKHYQKAHSGIL